MAASADSIDEASYLRDPDAAILAVAPELEPLRITYGEQFRMVLASNPLCPPAVMRLLVNESGPVLYQLASNTQVDPDTMTVITSKVEQDARRAPLSFPGQIILLLLMNDRCPEHLLREFSNRYAPQVAAHRDCPPDMLHRYSLEASSSYVLCAVARHPSTPTDALLNLLSRDLDAARRARIALAERGHEAVREAMTRTDTRGRRELATLVNANERKLLAHDSDPRIRYAVAKVEHDPAVLSQLAGDRHGRVRRAASDRVMEVVSLSA